MLPYSLLDMKGGEGRGCETSLLSELSDYNQVEQLKLLFEMASIYYQKGSGRQVCFKLKGIDQLFYIIHKDSGDFSEYLLETLLVTPHKGGSVRTLNLTLQRADYSNIIDRIIGSSAENGLVEENKGGTRARRSSHFFQLLRFFAIDGKQAEDALIILFPNGFYVINDRAHEALKFLAQHYNDKLHGNNLHSLSRRIAMVSGRKRGLDHCAGAMPCRQIER